MSLDVGPDYSIDLPEPIKDFESHKPKERLIKPVESASEAVKRRQPRQKAQALAKKPTRQHTDSIAVIIPKKKSKADETYDYVMNQKPSKPLEYLFMPIFKSFIWFTHNLEKNLLWPAVALSDKAFDLVAGQASPKPIN